MLIFVRNEKRGLTSSTNLNFPHMFSCGRRQVQDLISRAKIKQPHLNLLSDVSESWTENSRAQPRNTMRYGFASRNNPDFPQSRANGTSKKWLQSQTSEKQWQCKRKKFNGLSAQGILHRPQASTDIRKFFVSGSCKCHCSCEWGRSVTHLKSVSIKKGRDKK